MKGPLPNDGRWMPRPPVPDLPEAGAALPPASLQASLSLERLCRYVRRPAVSEKRMALTPNGKIRYPLKTSCRDGTTHVLFEPQDFIARLAALAPKPRVHLTRFHGVFAANSKHRIQVTSGKRGKVRGQAKVAASNWLEKTPQERQRAMTWMQPLKRVFEPFFFYRIMNIPACVVAVCFNNCVQIKPVVCSVCNIAGDFFDFVCNGVLLLFYIQPIHNND